MDVWAKQYFLRATRNARSRFIVGAASVFTRWELTFCGTGESSHVAGVVQSMSATARESLPSWPFPGRRGSGSSHYVSAAELVNFPTASTPKLKLSRRRFSTRKVETGATFLPGFGADAVNLFPCHGA